MKATEVNCQTSHWLSEDVFRSACAALPLVSIDLMITRPGDQGRELLLGLRNNRPAQGWWFTPGGRIRKNEPLPFALRRVAQEEVGLNLEWLNRAELLGAWDHFYTDSAFTADISTHYVNLPYALHLSADDAHTLTLPTGGDVQHQSWKWISIAEARIDQNVHEYVRAVTDRLLDAHRSSVVRQTD